MRVLIVNTSEREGGAAVAANRLMDALNNNGVKAKMLVRDKETDNITVVGLKGGLLQRFRFLWERWCVYYHLHFKRDHLFDLDMANTGFDITKLPEFKEADVIHLAWINQGFLSLKDIRKSSTAARLWYGPCMTCGQRRAFAISPLAVRRIRDSVITVFTFHGEASQPICPLACSTRRKRFTTIAEFISWLAASGLAIAHGKAVC